jgi:acyl carrier protein
MTKFITQESVASCVSEIVKGHLGESVDLSPETRLADDLSMDSLERIELGIKLEKVFGIPLANNKVCHSATLEDLTRLVFHAWQENRA